MSQSLILWEEGQAPPWEEAQAAHIAGEELLEYLGPLLVRLEEALDKRVVRTFAQTVCAIIRNRDRARTLQLTELGGMLLGPPKAQAGAKRLGTLLRHQEWKSQWIQEELARQAEEALLAWEAQGITPIAAWDGSVLEKHESQQLEGLCPVHSSHATRHTRMRKGYYRPPVGRICVPGLHCVGVVFASPIPTQGHPVLAAMRWWTTRGAHRSWQRDEEARLLQEMATRFGRRVIHVFDRGYACELWVRLCALVHKLRAVIRWKGKNHLVDEHGRCRAGWKAVIGKRQGHERRVFWDSRKHQMRTLRVGWAHVTHPSHPDLPLSLVVVRGFDQPWYLLSTDVITTEDQAWLVALAYLQRWQIEQVWRLDKSELGLESIRLWDWEARLKLLGIVLLAHGFLLRLLDHFPLRELLRHWLLQYGCPRPGKHCRLTLLPLSRLRAALWFLWQHHPPGWAIARLRPARLAPASLSQRTQVRVILIA